MRLVTRVIPVIAAMVAAAGACSDLVVPASDGPAPPTLAGAGRGPTLARQSNEHVTVQQAGYTLTLYPGWVSLVSVQEAGEPALELYRNDGTFPLPDPGAPSSRHELRLRGGEYERDLLLAVDDPMYHVARIRLSLFENERHTYGYGSGGEQRGTVLIEGRPGTAPTAAGGSGYELTLPPGFPGRATVQVRGQPAREIYAGTPGEVMSRNDRWPVQYVVRLRGGPYGRDLWLRVDNRNRDIARLDVELAGQAGEPEEIFTLDMDIITCPPVCVEPPCPPQC